MLAVVKKPRIELAIQGENTEELLAWISKKFEVNILSADKSDSISIEDTDFYKEMQSNRVGNLLEGARLKAGITQSELAQKLNVRQNMISDYERGKRRISKTMAERLAKSLNINVDRLT